MKNTRNIVHPLLIGMILGLGAGGVAWADDGGLSQILAASSGGKPIPQTMLHPAAQPAPGHAGKAQASATLVLPPITTASAPAKPIPFVNHLRPATPSPAASQAPVPAIPANSEKPATGPTYQPLPVGKSPVQHAATPLRTLPKPITGGRPIIGVQTPAEVQPTAVVHPQTAARLAPSEVMHPRNTSVTQGYVNPFTGQPGVIEHLSNHLSVLKLQTEIAKQQAEYSKYDNQILNTNGASNPAMRTMEQDIDAMHQEIAGLEKARLEKARQQAEVIQKKRNDVMDLTGMMTNSGKQMAIVKVGRKFHYVTVGDPVGPHATVRHMNRNSITLSNGTVLHTGVPIGYYRATSWKGASSSGALTSPASSLGQRLAQEAAAAGIHLGAGAHPVAPGSAPSPVPGAIRFPAP